MTKRDWSRVRNAKITAVEREKAELTVGGSVSIPGEHDYAIRKLVLKERWRKVLNRRRKAAKKSARQAAERA